MIHGDRIGSHQLNQSQHRGRGRQRLPEQVVAARVGLVRERRDHPVTGRGEECAQAVGLAGGLVLRPDDAGVGSATQAQQSMLEAEPLDDGSHRRPRPHDDALTRVRPGRRQRRQRQQMRSVVRADDEQTQGNGTRDVALPVAEGALPIRAPASGTRFGSA